MLTVRTEALQVGLRNGRAQLWAADADGDAHRSTEQALRGSDATIAACVVLETASEADAWAASERMMGELSGAPEVGVYRLMCSLHRDDLSREDPGREDPGREDPGREDPA